jgi:hypothetical protein
MQCPTPDHETFKDIHGLLLCGRKPLKLSRLQRRLIQTLSTSQQQDFGLLHLGHIRAAGKIGPFEDPNDWIHICHANQRCFTLLQFTDNDLKAALSLVADREVECVSQFDSNPTDQRLMEFSL